MSEYTFTSADVVRVVLELAEEKPSFVYKPGKTPEGYESQCLYRASETQPGCIVGQALTRLGVEETFLEGNEGNSVYDVLQNLHIAVESYDSDFLTRVQQKQDVGGTWISAVTPYRWSYAGRGY